MLKPSMQELLNKVGNRYLLVNLAAQRARDLSEDAESHNDPLLDKSVKLALDEIANGEIVYKHGPREEIKPINLVQDVMGTLAIDLDSEEEVTMLEEADDSLLSDDDEEVVLLDDEDE